MARQADPTEIAKYRTKLLTSPASLLQTMQQMREVLRGRSEQVFVERDLTASDAALNDETREAEFERLDEQILRVGARIDDLDEQIAEHEKKHPDAALQAKIASVGGAAPQHQPMVLSRQQRRQIQRQAAKVATEDANAEPDPEPESTSEPAEPEEPTEE